MARSTDNGRTFSPIQAAPNHVIARMPYLYYSGAGHPMGTAFEGGGTFFSNPNDDYLYRFLNQFKNTPSGDFGVTMMRTRKIDIDDPTSWRAFDGIGDWFGHFYPSGTYGKVVVLPFGTPFYIGWSTYFHQYIATGGFNGYYCFALSPDLFHWSSAFNIMPFDTQAVGSGSGLPSLLDPSYLAQTGNDSAANGGIVGQSPYLTFIRTDVSPTIQQQVVVQQLNFQGADTTPPVATVIAPAAGAYVAGTVVVSGTASDDRGVYSMQFKRDGQYVGGEATFPFPPSFLIDNWNTVLSGNGNHTLELVVRDQSGNTATSPLITVTVDNTPPTGVWVTAPFDGAYVGGAAVTVNGVASDNYAVAGVRFTLDNGPLSPEDTTFPYSFSPWSTIFINQGPHMLRAEARDLAGNITTSPPITVTIDNTAPTAVAITSPSNGAMIAGVVTVSATASDNYVVAGVSFLLDDVPMPGFDKTVPYSTTWNTLLTPSGSHTLKAQARDSAGNITTSSPITVVVNNGS